VAICSAYGKLFGQFQVGCTVLQHCAHSNQRFDAELAFLIIHVCCSSDQAC